MTTVIRFMSMFELWACREGDARKTIPLKRSFNILVIFSLEEIAPGLCVTLCKCRGPRLNPVVNADLVLQTHHFPVTRSATKSCSLDQEKWQANLAPAESLCRASEDKGTLY